MGNVCNKLWEMYNNYSNIKRVLIISREDFDMEINRIEKELEEEGK